MSQINKNLFIFFKSILSISFRDIKIQFRNMSYIYSIMIFFIMIILIFIFAIGPDDEELKVYLIPILWSILILCSCISINNLLKDDYLDGNFGIYQFTGISFELIAISKIFTSWILYQLPILILMPFIAFIIEINETKIFHLIITIAIGSPILTVFTLISSAMMLTNSKNLILGSIIMIPLCIPGIIFSIGAITNDQELFTAQINILLSIFFASLAIGPWVISGCIKIALKN